MKKVNKTSIIFTISFISHLFASSAANSKEHDFRTAIWAKGQSCTICHVVKKGLPSLTPPDARLTVDNTNLTPQESQAVGMHASNRLCYVCHKINQDTNGHTLADGLPASPIGPPLPPSVGNGTNGSIVVRVNNQGAKGLDCLGCHDVHNANSDHLLRADFFTTKPTL